MKVEDLFVVVEREGLGRALKCKLCAVKFNKEFIVVSSNDAERHLQAHQLYGDRLYEEPPSKPAIKKKIVLKKPQSQTLDGYFSSEEV